MTSKEFIFWLRGYLKALSKDADINKVISDIEQELDKVNKIELPYADKEAEKIVEDWIKSKPIPYTPFPNSPIVVMYGCQTSPTNYNPYITTNTDNTNKTE